MAPEHVDVLIVGAGLSGIGAAYYIQSYCPGKSYAVLEARPTMGGTWNLFHYPGVRSDSDMYTLSYSFHPWRGRKTITDGPSILAYIQETATTYGIDKKIRYQHRLCGASWSSKDALWTVDVEHAAAERGDREGGDAERVQMTCRFLYTCMGYYNYDGGYKPDWPGVERFKGSFARPQQWDTGLDYSGKSVVVIGSGATAITLVPAMAQHAAHVTMLQRTPTYVINLPAEDAQASWLLHHLPRHLAYRLARWKWILLPLLMYNLAHWRPQLVRRLLMNSIRKQLGANYDVDKDFNPPYNPWDQRVCVVPDGDLFRAIKSGKATVVTDHIETFTENGIRLSSGKELAADIVVTATGLVMKLDKGGPIVVDGKSVDPSKAFVYKGVMWSDVPNCAFTFGYTYASWTLKSELIAHYVCRLLNFMDKTGYDQCTPRDDPSMTEEAFVNFSSGYVKRALSNLPSQGSKPPWKVYQNYLLDLATLQYGALDDGTMEFRIADPKR